MKAISTFFLLFAIIASLASITPVFADHPATVEIAMGSSVPGCEETNECYLPYTITIHPGSTVTWTNEDRAHTVTAGGLTNMATNEIGLDYPGGNGFNSELFLVGDTFEHTFEVEGTYDYFCMIHPWMAGIVIVEAEEVMEEEAVVEEVMEEEVVVEEVMEEETVVEEVMEEEAATEEGGGCLVATATFGSELAPQVQSLRELRDNTLLSTSSGTSFMTGFNTIYYSFSPTIADLERENPIFKETVKIAITPLITSLSLLNYVEIDSDQDVLGYGIGVILLNIGMYFVVPAVAILKISQRIRK